MAKVGISISTTIDRRIIALSMRRVNLKTGISARLQSRMSDRMDKLAHEERKEMRIAIVSWHALSSWKRTRWSMCATLIRVPTNLAASRRYQNGFNLYFRMWREQKIVPPKQPISPCARRRLLSDASPWDYTP